MSPQRIGIIHPGAMGISLAAAAQNSGHEVYWASHGRSSQTHDRAAAFSLHDTSTLAQLCKTCDVIVSVCPPHAVQDVANQVLSHEFQGHFLDVNAIAPQRAREMGTALTSAGMTFTDGGIIGGPAWQPGKTWLYLSGPQAAIAASWFAAGPLETNVVGDTIGEASALKMCYAAYTKGTTALLCAVLAAAHQLGVQDALYAQWEREDTGAAEQSVRRVQQVTAK
ncbi:MAG TPA: NAD(P)-binding domain-containing protein, partial [Herpetosiphonaceae bacterium]